MSPEWFTLLGVLLGSIISQAGNIISRIASRESERKAIFEARFNKVETLLEDAIKRLNVFDVGLTAVDLSKKESKLQTLDTLRGFISIFAEIKLSLFSLCITKDKKFEEYAENIFSDFGEYFKSVIQQITNENLSVETGKSILPLFNTYGQILERIDTFRLHNYKL